MANGQVGRVSDGLISSSDHSGSGLQTGSDHLGSGFFRVRVFSGSGHSGSGFFGVQIIWVQVFFKFGTFSKFLYRKIICYYNLEDTIEILLL